MILHSQAPRVTRFIDTDLVLQNEDISEGEIMEVTSWRLHRCMQDPILLQQGKCSKPNVGATYILP